MTPKIVFNNVKKDMYNIRNLVRLYYNRLFLLKFNYIPGLDFLRLNSAPNLSVP